MLGHARPATTLNVYSHFVDSGDRAAADTIGQILDKTGHWMDRGWTEDGQRMDKPRGGKTEAESEDPA